MTPKPVRLNTHLPVEGGAACLTVADVNPQSRSRSGFGAIALAMALMKLEPEVIVEPKGTTVNLSLVQPSLGPYSERGNGTRPLDLTIKSNRGGRREQKKGKYWIFVWVLRPGGCAGE
jgi:hypothetical protein